MNIPRYLLIAALTGLTSIQSFAWGPDGHHTVGAIASGLIKGTQAESEVNALLGDISLIDAAVWADCAKGVDPTKNYQYQKPGKYPECKVFETPELEAEMSDFVRRNDKNCQPKPGEEICHKQYHYTDIAIQQSQYTFGPVGTREDDIVGAVVAAVHVLKGEAAPAPFDIKSKREALLLLAHYVGDMHQPLHVGAVYLNAKGSRVDPDQGTYDPTTATRGGNNIMVSGGNLHAKWDDIPASLKASKVSQAWLTQAGNVAATPGGMFDWPAAWATGTLGKAKTAFQGVKFGPIKQGHWGATLPKNYATTLSSVKKAQLTAGGARFAEVLKAIWP